MKKINKINIFISASNVSVCKEANKVLFVLALHVSAALQVNLEEVIVVLTASSSSSTTHSRFDAAAAC